MDARGTSPPSVEPRMLCLDCSYTLDHLDQRRCPECGREFDPADPTSYDGPHRERSVPWWVAISVITVAMYLPAMALCLAGKLELTTALVTPGWPGAFFVRHESLAWAIAAASLCLAGAAYSKLSDGAFIFAIVVSLMYGTCSLLIIEYLSWASRW